MAEPLGYAHAKKDRVSEYDQEHVEVTGDADLSGHAGGTRRPGRLWGPGARPLWGGLDSAAASLLRACAWERLLVESVATVISATGYTYTCTYIYAPGRGRYEVPRRGILDSQVQHPGGQHQASPCRPPQQHKLLDHGPTQA